MNVRQLIAFLGEKALEAPRPYAENKAIADLTQNFLIELKKKAQEKVEESKDADDS